MKTIIVPSNHKEVIFLYFGDAHRLCTPNELESIRDFVLNNNIKLPTQFNELEIYLKSFNLTVSLEIWPERNASFNYVWLIESSDQISQESWQNIMNTHESIWQNIVYFQSNFQGKIRRINKNLVPFL